MGRTANESEARGACLSVRLRNFIGQSDFFLAQNSNVRKTLLITQIPGVGTIFILHTKMRHYASSFLHPWERIRTAQIFCPGERLNDDFYASIPIARRNRCILTM